MKAPLLIESIRIFNKRVYNIDFHNARCNYSRQQLFGSKEILQLRPHIDTSTCENGLYKCKITFNNTVQSVTITPYTIRTINNIGIIYDDIGIDYRHKYATRQRLDTLRSRAKECDEIIIMKDGLVTDAYYYNVVVDYQGKLLTPATPLLEGIQRRKLLKSGKVTATDISLEVLQASEKIYLINALTRLGEIEVSPSGLEYI